jgi:hypothetical protein
MTEQELIAHFQQQVDNIPTIRPCITLYEESMLSVLTHLIENHTRNQGDDILMRSCMIKSKGHLNPAFVVDAIKQWKESYSG